MFHARKTVIQGSPERSEDAARVINEQVIPAAQQMSGFVGGYWLLERETGKGITFTFFDSPESLEASSAPADQIRSKGVEQIGASVVSVEHLEVAVNTGDKIHSTAGFARVIEFSHEPAQLESVLNRIKEDVIPRAKQMPGFQGGFWVVDRATGKGTGVTLFDTKANLEASLATTNQVRQDSSQATGANVGEPKHFEIVARAVPQAAGAKG